MNKRSLITLLAGLAFVIVLAVVFLRGDQLQRLIATVERGTPVFLVLAVIAQLCKYFMQGASFYWCFKAANAKMPMKECVLLVFQTFFMDTIMPSFNISGTSTAVDAAVKHGIEAGRATGAALLRQVSISASFVVVMVVGFGILLVTGKLKVGWLILGIGATLVVGALVTGMVLAALRPQWVLKILAPFEHVIDKMLARLHKHSIDASVKSLVSTYASSAKAMGHNVPCICTEMGFAVLANVFEIACFGFVGLAFGVNNIEAVICVYVVSTLAATASPVPQGVGVVEGAALVAFTLFHIEQASGMAIIMVFRVVSFWLPFILGALLMRGIKPNLNMLNKQASKRA